MTDESYTPDEFIPTPAEQSVIQITTLNLGLKGTRQLDRPFFSVSANAGGFFRVNPGATDAEIAQAILCFNSQMAAAIGDAMNKGKRVVLDGVTAEYMPLFMGLPLVIQEAHIEASAEYKAGKGAEPVPLGESMSLEEASKFTTNAGTSYPDLSRSQLEDVIGSLNGYITDHLRNGAKLPAGYTLTDLERRRTAAQVVLDSKR